MQDTSKNRSTPASLSDLDFGDNADNLAVFLDVDGTLLEIVDDPDRVVVPEGLIDILDRLQQRLNGAVALVSGRTIDTLDRLFAPLKLAVAGQHGLEIRLADRTISQFDAPLDQLADANALLDDLVSSTPSLKREHKGMAVAVHYRNADQHLDALLKVRDRILDLYGHSLQAIHGKKVIEFKPAGMDKGKAIETMMATPPFSGRHPVFAGDDTTDEDGFAKIRDMDGTAIRIGDREPTLAQWRTPTVTTFRNWLADLSEKPANTTSV